MHATGAELHEAEEALVAMRGRHAARQAQADEREQLLLQQALSPAPLTRTPNPNP